MSFAALASLRRCPCLLEGMILSTCNRVEIAATLEDEADLGSTVETFLAESRSVERDWVVPYLYRYDGSDAILLEHKDDMRKRGLASPDDGDALALTFAYPVAKRDWASERRFEEGLARLKRWIV